MAFNTTALDISTAPTQIISTGTTWADLSGASLYDPISFSAFNDSAVRVWVSGTSSITTASVGMPILSSGYMNATLLASDAFWALTTGSTATLRVSAGRQ